MTRRLTCSFLCLLFACACSREPSGTGSAPDPNAIVISVDGKTVTHAMVEQEVIRELAAVQKQMPPDLYEKVAQSTRERVITQSMNTLLLLGAAEREKITISPGELLKELKRHQKAGRLSRAMTLSVATNTPAIRQYLETHLKAEKYLAAHLPKTFPVTDQEVQDYAREKWKEITVLPDTAWVMHLQIGIAPGDSEDVVADKLTTANALRDRLLKGEDFAALAGQHSSCPSRQAGGYLGAVRRGDLVEPLDTTVFSQVTGKIGPVVKSRKGYHIFKVLRRSDRGTIPVDEIAVAIRAEKKQQAKAAMIDDLKATARIKRY